MSRQAPQNPDEKIAELREVIREANSSIKALNQARKDFDVHVQESMDEVNRYCEEISDINRLIYEKIAEPFFKDSIKSILKALSAVEERLLERIQVMDKVVNNREVLLGMKNSSGLVNREAVNQGAASLAVHSVECERCRKVLIRITSIERNGTGNFADVPASAFCLEGQKIAAKSIALSSLTKE